MLLAGVTAAGAGVLDPPLPKGSAAPPVALPSLQHGPIDLQAQRGRVVVVHFFATWCEPCRDEMAGLQRLAGRLKDRPLTILAVDVGEVEARVRRFFESQPVSFPILLDEARTAKKAWKVEVFPSTFVLDRDQIIRLFAAGPVDWDSPAVDASLAGLLEGRPQDPQDTLPNQTLPQEIQPQEIQQNEPLQPGSNHP